MDQRTYDLSQVEPASREFADFLRLRHPEWSPLFTMIQAEPDGPWRLNVRIPSPTGEHDRALEFWMNADEPSIAFGHWHSHRGLCHSADEFMELADAVRRDLLVEYFDLSWDGSHFWDVLDLREEDALLELLTGPYCSGRIRIRSWGGTKDGEHALS